MARRGGAAALGLALLSGCSFSDGPPPSARTAAAAAPADPAAAINQLAEDYVRLTLEIGTHDADYVDAYYGPAAWRTAATANPRAIPLLRAEVAALRARLAAIAPGDAAIDRARHAALTGQLTAAATRLAMLAGEKIGFLNEAEGLFGVRPVIRPLAAYDPYLAEIARLVPPAGPDDRRDLATRVDALFDQFIIPADRLKPVFEAAMAACRARTAAHIAMPAGETFELGFVTNKAWSGYNYYLGNFKSRIEINTDLPVRLPRAIDLGCHEGYPGHHLMGSLAEQRLVRQRGWVEYSVYPLFSPQAVIAEGTANHGIIMAFPGDEKQAEERRVMLPLAGIPVPDDDAYWQVQAAMKGLAQVRITIAQQYLDGEISRADAIAATQRYLLTSPARAAQSVGFTEKYRSYVINYSLGEELVRAYLEHGGADAATQWARFERLISAPVHPRDLLVR